MERLDVHLFLFGINGRHLLKWKIPKKVYKPYTHDLIYIFIMGKCESATSSIGIKILLSDIVSQINDKTFKLIMELLDNGFIEDDNDYFNEVYTDIIYNSDVMDNDDFEDVKNTLTNEFQNRGSITKYKFSSREEPTLSNGCLFDKYLLFPVKEILSTDRWGYDRSGTNGSSRALDFDFSIDTEKYNELNNFEIVFILKQYSG